MIIGLVTSDMLWASYCQRTVDLLITTDSSERRVLDMYGSITSVLEEAHEVGDGARGCWCQ